MVRWWIHDTTSVELMKVGASMCELDTRMPKSDRRNAAAFGIPPEIGRGRNIRVFSTHLFKLTSHA
jgi:hypothetical protein